MKKVFEKIIEKQEELFQDLNVIEVLSHVDFDSTIQNSLENFLKAITNEAIEIVKQEAEKYEECNKDCGDCEAYNIETDTVKHGSWFLLDECANEGVYCSVCHKKVYKTDYANQKIKSKYCPNCGAIMDLDGE